MKEEGDVRSLRSKMQQLEEQRLRHNDTKFSSRRNHDNGFLELSRDRLRGDHDV